MKRYLRLAPICAALFLSSALASATEVPTAEPQSDSRVEAAAESRPISLRASNETSAASVARSDGSNAVARDVLQVEPQWMGMGAEKQSLGSASLYPGYCYNDCRTCYPVGPLNAGCTSPEYPGVKFPCTSIPLC